MNTFDKCRTIRRILIDRAAEVMAYKSWSNEFAAKQIRNFPEDLKEMNGGSELFGIQPSDLTEEEMIELGFGIWNAKNPMRLIPLWLLPFLADEINVECIDGSKVMHKSEMDNDNRFGCLAYGVIPKDVSMINNNQEQMEDALTLILKYCIHTNQDAMFKAFSKMSEQELAWISQAIYIHLIEPNPECKLN